MKITAKKSVLFGALLIGAACGHAQLPPDSMSPPPPPQVAMGNRPPAPPRPDGPAVKAPFGRKQMQDGLQALTTINGKLVDYTVNDEYAYDGFTLQIGSQTVNVKFAPHLGEAIMKAAKKGETISVTGFNETTPSNANAFHLVSAKVGNNQLNDIPPVPPTTPPTPEQVNYNGNITELKKNLEGLPNGVLLDNKVTINIPPHIMDQMQSMLKTGQKLAVSGFKMVPPTGVVMAQNNVVIRPQTITLNNQTYLVR